MRVNIVAGKESFREAIAFFRALHIPKFTALNVKQYFPAQIGAANPQEYDSIDAVARRPSQFFQGKNTFRTVDVAIFNVRKLCKKDGFRFSIFGEMARHGTVFAHVHHCFVRFGIDR